MNAQSRRRVQSPPPFQADLFGASEGMPEGFRYRTEALTAAEEAALARALSALPFKPFEFHGHLANRQGVGFGYRYDDERRAVVEAAPIPPFLEPVRQRIAEIFDRPAETFQQALVNDYRVGAGIGWHRDKPRFGEVVGLSLLAPCTLRLRRKSHAGWDRVSLSLAPRSAYLLSGPSRTLWEHSIPPLDRPRYSITFRTLVR
jgi:alkylated DNA repair dioxygenase AlkB